MLFLMLLFIFLIFSCAHGNLDKPEGTPCIWERAEGKCLLARQCLSFVVEKTRGNFTVFSGKQPPICSFQGKEPVICCVSCDNLGTNIKDLHQNKHYNSGRKYEAQCLIYQHLLPYLCSTGNYIRIIDELNLREYLDDTPRLNRFATFNETRKCYDYDQEYTFGIGGVGGEDTERGDFPHMALLGYGKELDSVQWLCGGSLISERHILTAAHCASHPQLGPVTYVALGMLKRSDPPHYWKRYKVRTFYNHEGYTPPHKYHDIAIVETELSINLTSGVYPACLTHEFSLPGDKKAYATGWGSLGPGKADADVMQRVTVSKFTEAECSSQFPAHRLLKRGYNHTTQMCYGGREEVRDTCKGDSGGPLQMRNNREGYCQYAIIGVTSSGPACGIAGQAGLYTRVSYYLPWIEDIVWPSNNLTVS